MFRVEGCPYRIYIVFEFARFRFVGSGVFWFWVTVKGCRARNYLTDLYVQASAPTGCTEQKFWLNKRGREFQGSRGFKMVGFWARAVDCDPKP